MLGALQVLVPCQPVNWTPALSGIASRLHVRAVPGCFTSMLETCLPCACRHDQGFDGSSRGAGCYASGQPTLIGTPVAACFRSRRWRSEAFAEGPEWNVLASWLPDFIPTGIMVKEGCSSANAPQCSEPVHCSSICTS